MLALTAGVAGRRGLGGDPPRGAGRAGPARAVGLVTLLGRLHICPRQEGGQLTGPNPIDRGKRGSKYHLLADRSGIPLYVIVSGANRHDSIYLEPVLDSMPAIEVGGRGHPRRRPVKLHGGKGCDNRRYRSYLRRLGSPRGSL